MPKYWLLCFNKDDLHMRIVKLTKANHVKVLSLLERILRSGGVAVVPTDTVYGMVGDATSPEVIRKIFVMKQRPEERALPVFVKDIAAARKYAYISDVKAKFLERVWPGPVTAVFQHKEKLPAILTGSRNTMGVRVPNHPLLLELLPRFEAPLVQTSANISSLPSAKTIKQAALYFKDLKVRPDLMIDCGTLESKPSTVVDFTRDEPIILRTGLVSRAELDRLLEFVQESR